MKFLFSKEKKSKELTNLTRSALGFVLGLIIMIGVTNVFTVNDFDYENIKNGVEAILSGINPWAAESNSFEFFNPPYSVLFLWPIVFVNPKIILVFGGALIFAVLFFQKSWVAFSWFGTNLFLWIVAAGHIDMYIMGAGILLLFISDEIDEDKLTLLLRVLGYGLLMIKPQGGLFIVVLYVLLRKDWRGVLVSFLIYGIFFINYYPDWFRVLVTNPPIGQDYMHLSILGKYGWITTIIIAFGVSFSRPWEYWQLGAALSGILSPYGMPGIPVLLVLTGVDNKKAIPIVIIFSWCLAILTWITPPENVDYYKFIGPFMEIYHLVMLGLAFVLAIYPKRDLVTDHKNRIDLRNSVLNIFSSNSKSA